MKAKLFVALQCIPFLWKEASIPPKHMYYSRTPRKRVPFETQKQDYPHPRSHIRIHSDHMPTKMKSSQTKLSLCQNSTWLILEKKNTKNIVVEHSFQTLLTFLLKLQIQIQSLYFSPSPPPSRALFVCVNKLARLHRYPREYLHKTKEVS